MFNALAHKKKNPNKTRTTATATSSSRPRSCNYRNNAWQCTLANGRTLAVSGQSFIKALRKATGGSKAVRASVLTYPKSGKGQCMLRVTYTNGTSETLRGRCGASKAGNPAVGASESFRIAPDRPSLPPTKPKPHLPTGELQVMDIGQRCCFDPELMLIVCTDPNNPYNGREVAQIMSLDESAGTAILNLKPLPGQRGLVTVKAPLCADPSDVPPPAPPTAVDDCCFDVAASVIVCPNNTDHPAHGLPAQLVTLFEDNNSAVVEVTTGDHTGQIHLKLCPGTPTPTLPPSGGEDCCYDPVLGKIFCSDVSSPLNGADVVLEDVNTGSGTPRATVYVGGDPNAGMRVPLCETPDCCLDLATSTLVCESDPSSSFNGLKVGVEQVGIKNARVTHASLLPHGFAYVPLCATPPEVTGQCCFDQDTMQIVCADASNPLHGTTAGIVTEFQLANGVKGVSVAWPGGGMRLPLCGSRPPEECPPAYCCVNIDTMTFICPGTPELDGEAADVAEIKEVNGFTYAVLTDKTFVPICGKDCPPPELCPDGMWRTPTGDCAIPECPECPATTCPECPTGECPTCPPGYLLDTQTGECVQCPSCPPKGDCPTCPPQQGCPPQQPCPPGGGSTWTGEEPCCPPTSWWELAGHCCENCAHGKECEGGCGDDCDCGKEGNASHAHDHAHAHAHAPQGAATWIAQR